MALKYSTIPGNLGASPYPRKGIQRSSISELLRRRKKSLGNRPRIPVYSFGCLHYGTSPPPKGSTPPVLERPRSPMAIESTLQYRSEFDLYEKHSNAKLARAFSVCSGFPLSRPPPPFAPQPVLHPCLTYSKLLFGLPKVGIDHSFAAIVNPSKPTLETTCRHFLHRDLPLVGRGGAPRNHFG